MVRSENDINVGTAYPPVSKNAHNAFPLISEKPADNKMSWSQRTITTSI